MATRLIILLPFLLSAWTAASQVKLTTTDIMYIRQKLQISTDTAKYFTSITDTITASSTHRQAPTAKSVYDYVQSAIGGAGGGHVVAGDGSPVSQKDTLNFVSTDAVSASVSNTGTATNVTLDLAQQGATTGQVLKWDGAAWTPDDDATTAGASGHVLANAGAPVTQRDTADFLDTGDINFTVASDATKTTITGDINTGAVGATELASTAVTAGSYTAANITVDADGRLTAASNGTVDASATNEGSLTVGAGSGTTSVISSNTSGSTDVTISASTGLSISEAGNTITLTNTGDTDASNDLTTSTTFGGDVSGTYDNLQLGTGVVGATELAATAVAAGSYGSATQVAQITVDADGRLTSASNVNISGVAPADGDKGDIDVTASGATWTVDTSVITSLKILDGTVGNTDLADGVGGIYKGSGNIAAGGTLATVTSGETFSITFADFASALYVNDATAQIQLSSKNGSGLVLDNTYIDAYTPFLKVTNPTSSLPGEFRIYEKTSSGNNYTSIKSPILAADLTYILPATSTDGYLRNTSGTWSWDTPTVSNVTDGDKGDIDVVSGVWTIDTGVVNSLKILDGTVSNDDLASGAGGIYKGSGTIPAATIATLSAAGNFTINYDGSGAFYVDDFGGTVSLFSKDGTSQVTANSGAVELSGNTQVQMTSGNNIIEVVASSGAIIGGGTGAASLRLLEPSGSGTNYTEFITAAQSTSQTYTLPTDVPADGEILRWNTGGTLDWAPDGTGVNIYTSNGDITYSTDRIVTLHTNTTLQIQDTIAGLIANFANGTVSFLDGVFSAGVDNVGITTTGVDLDYGTDMTMVLNGDATTTLSSGGLYDINYFSGNTAINITDTGLGLYSPDNNDVAALSNGKFDVQMDAGGSYRTESGAIYMAYDGGNISIGGGSTASELRFYEASGSGNNYFAITAQDMAADFTYTWPADDGTSGEVLQTDGSGTLTWATPSGGVSDGDKGDITVSGSGATWTIDADVVTYAKMQNVSATARIMGRNTAGAGDMEELDASTVKTMLSLNNVENTALSTWAGTANITTVGTIVSGTWTGSDIAYANIAQGSARSVLGVTGNATADVASIQGTADQVLRVNSAGTALAFGTIVSAGIADGTIANADLDAATGGIYKGSGTIPSGTASTMANNTTASYAITFFNGNGGYAINESTNSSYVGSEDGEQFFYVTNTLAEIGSGTSKMDYIDGVLRVYDSDATQYVALQTPATGSLTANYTLTLPVDDGTANQLLQTDGSGALSWVTVAAGGDIANGGNTTGATVTIGTNDANSLAFKTNNVVRAIVTGEASSGGAWTMTDVTANTNSLETMYTDIVNSSGTAATGLGLRTLYQIESTTTDAQNAAAIDVLWSDATHVSRTGDIVFRTVASAAALAEAFRIGGTTYALTATASVSNTNTVADRLIIRTNSTGTASNGLGGGLAFQMETSTTDNVDAVKISPYWNNASHGNRTSGVRIFLTQSAGTLTNFFEFLPGSIGFTNSAGAASTTLSTSGITTGAAFTLGNSSSSLTLGGSSGYVVIRSSASQGIILDPNGLTSATCVVDIGNTNSSSHTSSTKSLLNFSQNFSPASGTGVFNFINISSTINQTGGANGVSRCILLNPTLTSAADFRALEIGTNSGKAIYQTGGSATNNFVGATGFGATTAPTDKVEITGNLALLTAGNKLKIATGSNASIGVSGAMTAGSITISTTAVTSSSIIILTHSVVGGTVGVLSVGTITNGTSFVINSSSATDTSTVNWWIVN